MRLKLLNPPGVIKTLDDVYVLHGTRRTKQYIRYVMGLSTCLLTACVRRKWPRRPRCFTVVPLLGNPATAMCHCACYSAAPLQQLNAVLAGPLTAYVLMHVVWQLMSTLPLLWLQWHHPGG